MPTMLPRSYKRRFPTSARSDSLRTLVAHKLPSSRRSATRPVVALPDADIALPASLRLDGSRGPPGASAALSSDSALRELVAGVD